MGCSFCTWPGPTAKGRSGAMTTSILGRAGYRAGFYTSPHLVSFRERFTIGGDRIGRAEVVRLTERVRSVCAPEEPPTFFEFVTAMAFLYFKERGVDIAVMETGLGGRLDATNVARPLIGVITGIGLEHTEYLGPTLAHVAREKAGIIKPGMTVITGERRPHIRAIFEETARETGGRLLALGRDFKTRRTPDGFDYWGEKGGMKGLTLGLPGPHQISNAALALSAVEQLGRHGFSITGEHIRAGLQSTSWPGRGEVFPGPPRLMLDGAHNPGAARALAGMLEQMDYDRLLLVLGIMADKDIRRIMSPLLPLADRVFLTRPEYFRAADPETLAAVVREARGPVECIDRVPEALEAARAAAGPNDLVLVTGSLFTVGEARAYLTGEADS